VHEAGRQLAIVGQENQAPAVQVQPPDREEAAHAGGDPIDDGLPATVIADAGQDAGRLVQHQVGPFRDRPHERPSDRHLVEGGLDLLAGLGREAIDRDLAGRDQLIRFAPRGDAGAR